MLYGDITDPSTLLIPDAEREWQTWKNGWRTVDQPVGWRFKPLYEIGNEVYTVYFPVKKSKIFLPHFRKREPLSPQRWTGPGSSFSPYFHRR